MPNNMIIKPRDWLIIAIGAVIIIILVVITVNEVSPSSKSHRTNSKEADEVVNVEGNDAAKSTQTYQVEYKVICVGCDVSYTNATGGTDLLDEVTGAWSKIITAQGDDFIHLSAQNGDADLPITVTIKVNGKVLETETSNGRFAIADVSCYPKDVNLH
jgi:uncharacterized protein (UPF0333 family)